MYIALGQEHTAPRGQSLMSTENSCHFAHLLPVSKYSSVFRENRCPPPPKPVYGGNFSHEAVTLKIRSRSPKSNKLLILSD